MSVSFCVNKKLIKRGDALFFMLKVVNKKGWWCKNFRHLNIGCVLGCMKSTVLLRVYYFKDDTLCFKCFYLNKKLRKMSQRIFLNENHSIGLRKIRKPLMEKKRRARINDSLEKLKQILLKNTVAITCGSRPTKLEKADILEMTVRYLQILQKQQSSATTSNGHDCVTSTTSIDLVKPHALKENRPCTTLTSSSTNSINSFSMKNKSENKENINCVTFDGETERKQSMVTVKFKKSHSSAFKEINKNSLVEAEKNMEERPWRPW